MHVTLYQYNYSCRSLFSSISDGILAIWKPKNVSESMLLLYPLKIYHLFIVVKIIYTEEGADTRFSY